LPGTAQVVPQVPQLLVSVARFAQKAAPALAAQMLLGAAQAIGWGDEDEQPASSAMPQRATAKERIMKGASPENAGGKLTTRIG